MSHPHRSLSSLDIQQHRSRLPPQDPGSPTTGSPSRLAPARAGMAAFQRRRWNPTTSRGPQPHGAGPSRRERRASSGIRTPGRPRACARAGRGAAGAPRPCQRPPGSPAPAAAAPAPAAAPFPSPSLTSLPLPPPRERRGRRRLLHAGGPAAPDSPTPPPPCRGRPRLAGAAHCVNCVTAATQPAVATATRGAGRGGAAWWRPAVAPRGGAVPGRPRIPAGNSRWDAGRAHLLRAEASAGLVGTFPTDIIAERSH